MIHRKGFRMNVDQIVEKIIGGIVDGKVNLADVDVDVGKMRAHTWKAIRAKLESRLGVIDFHSTRGVVVSMTLVKP